MKKIYISPETECLEMKVFGSMLAESITTQNQQDYGKGGNYRNENISPNSAFDLTTDNFGEISSQSKGRGGDWGSIW